MDLSDEKFMVFISHKHDDHALAERVKHLIEKSQQEGHHLLRLRARHHRGGGLAARGPRRPRPKPHARAALHGAVEELGLVPVRDRPVHPFRQQRHPGSRLPLPSRPGLAEPARRPARRPRDGRQDWRIPRRALPQDVDCVRRLAPGRARPRRQGREGERGGESHRGGVLPFRLDFGLLSVPSRGPFALR